MRPLLTALMLSVLIGGADAVPPPQRALDPAPLEERVAAALDRAGPALQHGLRNLAGGNLALTTLAALHDRMDPREQPLKDAVIRLRRYPSLSTYGLGLRLMVEAMLPKDLRDMEQVERDALRLRQHQCRDGSFGYGPGSGGRGDLSCTQYGILGLRAAAHLGVEIPPEVWSAAGGAALRCQGRGGGFSYSGKRGATASMTAAGIGVLEICAQCGSSRVRDRVQRRIRAGWEWLARNRAQIGSSRARWCFYFHHGLERAAMLCGQEEVGGRDWYAVGAEMLLAGQLESGAWPAAQQMVKSFQGKRTPSDIDTAFAVLFLRRGFRLHPPAADGPISGAKAEIGALAGLSVDSAAAEVDRAVDLLVLRGRLGAAEAVRGLGSSVPIRRRTALKALTRLAGADFGYHPFRNPPENAAAIRAAEGWLLAWQALPPGKPAPQVGD